MNTSIETNSIIGHDRVVYTVEQSGLDEVSASFIKLRGRSLIEWLDFFNKGGPFSVLEIGGGRCQVAAREIIESYANLTRYFAVEPREIDLSGYLESDRRYTHINCRIEDLSEQLPSSRFNVIFAHYVAEHMRNPFACLEQASRIGAKHSVFFCNRIPVYREVFDAIVSYLNRTGVQLSFEYQTTESALTKKDMRRVNLGVVLPEDPIHIPVTVGSPMTDFEGKCLSVAELTFNPEALR